MILVTKPENLLNCEMFLQLLPHFSNSVQGTSGPVDALVHSDHIRFEIGGIFEIITGFGLFLLDANCVGDVDAHEAGGGENLVLHIGDRIGLALNVKLYSGGRRVGR